MNIVSYDGSGNNLGYECRDIARRFGIDPKEV